MARRFPRATLSLTVAALAALLSNALSGPDADARSVGTWPVEAASEHTAGGHRDIGPAVSGEDRRSPAWPERREQLATTAAPTTAQDPAPPAGGHAVEGEREVGSGPRPAARTQAPREPEIEGASISAEGHAVAPGGAVDGDGDLVRYTVEVEPGIGEDLDGFAATVEEALHDPRSWARDVRLERVADPRDAEIRVLLATPDTVDRLCAEAGLDTMGDVSCWNQTFAALNLMRWTEGADGFDDLRTYRRYLVNHEFGHGLGHEHVGCPEEGALAPVMMQQTLGVEACVANGWPYPSEDAD